MLRREREGAHATEEFSCGERKGETKRGRGGKTRSQSVAPTIPALYTRTQAAVAEEKERRRFARVVRWEGGRFHVRWNVYVIRASCIISRLRVSLSTLCHATVVYVLSRRNFSRVCRPLARDSLYPICRILIYSWNVFGYRSIFRKGEIRRIRFKKFRFDFHTDNFDEKDALLYDCYNLINSTDIFFFFSASRASTLERYVMNVLITPCIYYGNRVRPCVSDFARTVLASRFTEYGISKGE